MVKPNALALGLIVRGDALPTNIPGRSDLTPANARTTPPAAARNAVAGAGAGIVIGIGWRAWSASYAMVVLVVVPLTRSTRRTALEPGSCR